jgi:hypothetical protein
MMLHCLIVDDSPRFLDAARVLLERQPGVIMISTHAEQDYADLIAASPAVGFLPKAALSAGAIRDLLASRGDGDRGEPVSGPSGS